MSLSNCPSHQIKGKKYIRTQTKSTHVLHRHDPQVQTELLPLSWDWSPAWNTSHTTTTCLLHEMLDVAQLRVDACRTRVQWYTHVWKPDDFPVVEGHYILLTYLERDPNPGFLGVHCSLRSVRLTSTRVSTACFCHVRYCISSHTGAMAGKTSCISS